MKKMKYVGLDVHAETIAIALADTRGEVRYLGQIRNRPDSLKKKLRQLGKANELLVCYEAGPCGYDVYWRLHEVGIQCEVVAPTLIPTRPGERVKTDRLDAEKLARLYRAGELTMAYVPTPEHEALRDLIRARGAAKEDQTRARHRLTKFLLRQGRRKPEGVRNWTAKHGDWINQQTFRLRAHQETFLDYRHEVEHANERLKRLEVAIDRAVDEAPAEIQEVIAALQALRGVAKLTSATLVAEIGEISRFSRPSQLMAYAGVVPSEHSSGGSTRKSSITKTGNRHLRRVLVESAWSYRFQPKVAHALKKRQEGLDQRSKEIAWSAQHRLHGRYRSMMARGKEKQKVVTAVARELLGFIWSIGTHIESQQQRAAC